MGPLVATLLSCISVPLPSADFLNPYDLVWEAAPARWLTGIPLANGDIGALVWGDAANLHVTLDKYDAWETREVPLKLTYQELRKLVADGKRKEAEECMRTESLYGDGPRPTRLPMPRLELNFEPPCDVASSFMPPPSTWESGRLRLGTATAEIDTKVQGCPVHVEMFVHARENIVQIRVKNDVMQFAKMRTTAAAKQEKLPPGWPLAIHVGLDHLSADAKATLKRWGYPEAEVQESQAEGSLLFKAPSGYAYAVAWKRDADAATGTQTITLALLSTADAADPLAAAKALIAREVSETDHRAWWSEYWNRSFLTIPDARLEALYYAEMYKLGCLSRPGKYPITLQGLWTLDGGMPPWAGDYHLDMNVEQSYWPIYTANRLELGEPLYRTFSACIPRWRAQCKDFFGFDGIWAGCAIGPKGERIYGYSGVELWPGNAAWLAHHYWLHYLYSRDKTFLREQAQPMIRLAFMTYANLLEKGNDGKLHVPLSYSPEYGEGSFDAYCKDPNCDLALIRFLGNALIKSDEVLAIQDDMAAKARDVLAGLTEYIHSSSLCISDDTPLKHSHRHFSHLMAIHPLSLLTRDGSDADKNLIRQSLHEIRVKGTGEWTGWAFPWMSLIASRAGYGNTAWQMLDTYAGSFIMPNTFHINGDPRIHGFSLFDYEPMTLEAGFGAAAATMEMLLQSYDGCIRVFPTIPDQWHDAYFAGLRAEGAFLVTAKLAEGKTRFLAITSEAGEPCRVKNPFGGDAELSDTGSAAAPRKLSGETFMFDTNPGASFLLYPEGERPTDEQMKPPQYNRRPEDLNFYGVKKLPRF